MGLILAYDLGTGGMKASLFDESGESLASSFISCKTYYPQNDFREQKPASWWKLTVDSTHSLLSENPHLAKDIEVIALSGHSLGVVPLSSDGKLLSESVPIWSDARAGVEAAEFFKKQNESQWYSLTGNGFPAALYSLFKIMWYQKHDPHLYDQTESFIGTKDYINFKLTGEVVTDHSYASGSGLYNLIEGKYEADLANNAGVDLQKFPTIEQSSTVIGHLQKSAASELGLSETVKVVCGAVDNSCMAAGAGCIGDGQSYLSLGTSAWIAVASDKPVINEKSRPYVFAHLVPGQFVSANAIFSAGNSFRWVRDLLYSELINGNKIDRDQIYSKMEALAAGVVAGSNRLIFNPSLAGGTALDGSQKIRGAWSGLDLSHGKGEMIRSAMEGIAFNLKTVLNALESQTTVANKMLLVGGGGKSPLWRQIMADILEREIYSSLVGEDAGSLGAAACGAVGAGLWDDFDPLVEINKAVQSCPISADSKIYQKIYPLFNELSQMQSHLGEKVEKVWSSIK